MVSRDLILNNFWWKVTAFFLAILVWLVVKSWDLPASATAATQLIQARTKGFAAHPLLIIREATDQRPINIEPTQVQIEVAGPPAEMAALRESDIQAFVDLGEVRANGRARIRVYMPRGLRLERLEPKEASVRILPGNNP
jgi:YbbR domain-containing protein